MHSNLKLPLVNNNPESGLYIEAANHSHLELKDKISDVTEYQEKYVKKSIEWTC